MCGRLPVFSSCSMTATTTSSLMPSVSIFGPSSGPGDGGGVCCAARGGDGRWSWNFTDSRRCSAGGGNVDPDGCDRFSRFDGGDVCSDATASLLRRGGSWVADAAAAVDGGGRWARELGIGMPIDGSDSDLRRVLYGIFDCDGCAMVGGVRSDPR